MTGTQEKTCPDCGANLDAGEACDRKQLTIAAQEPEPTPTPESLIVLTQLPIITEQLELVRPYIEKRVRDALSLVCTENNYREIKQLRAKLNKEATEYENRRKAVKAAITAPYERFEQVYRECVGGLYAEADRQLKKRIGEVEEGLRQGKLNEVMKYFGEYRQSIGLSRDEAPYEVAGIKISMSVSLSKLRAQAKDWLDGVKKDIDFINSQEDSAEILVEYLKCRDTLTAVQTVKAHHAAIEAAKKQQKEAAERAAQEEESRRRAAEAMQDAEEAPLAAPVMVTPVPPVAEPQKRKLSFSVTATIDALRALKKFLDEGGYEYEQS